MGPGLHGPRHQAPQPWPHQLRLPQTDFRPPGRRPHRRRRDAFLIETSQDLLQAKAAVIGCKQAIVTRGTRLPIFVEVNVETTGTMLMGSEIGAALTVLEPLGVVAIGLNCATGPDE